MDILKHILLRCGACLLALPCSRSTLTRPLVPSRVENTTAASFINLGVTGASRLSDG